MIPQLKVINQELEDFRTKDIQVVPGYYFNQRKMINTIYLYLNSKFETGEIDDEGDRKYFYNVVRNPCKIFSKAIDFDTKNIRLLTTGGGNPFKTWYSERDLKYWMRDKQFGKMLNRIFKEIPEFGSVVLKIVDNTPMFVDLRNFYCNQSADTLDNSSFITEIHPYSIPQFKKVAKLMGWEDARVKETIEKFRGMKDAQYINVFERYGELADEKYNYSYKKIYVADVGTDITEQQTNKEISGRGVLLSEMEIDEHPYWEFHKDKISGRWLGVGVVEELIEPQVKQNEIANLQSKTSYWAALRIFQTRDNAINRNLFTDVNNGEVINSDSEITQIDMSDRNLAFFNEEFTKWMSNRDELSFSYDVVQGERLPAGTPLGSAQIAISQTLSYFEQKQEDIAMDIKEMIYSVILPNFQKESTKEHTLRLVGEDLDTYFEMVKNILINDEIVTQILRGQIPDKNVISLAVEENFKRGKEILLPIPKNFYSDTKYDLDIDITGESVDTRVKNATLFALLQAITVDPMMTQDPMKRKILFAIAEGGGISPNDFFGVPRSSQQMLQQQMGSTWSGAGGGVSKPTMTPNPVPGESMSTV
jgi:hypothetical protein